MILVRTGFLFVLSNLNQNGRCLAKLLDIEPFELPEVYAAKSKYRELDGAFFGMSLWHVLFRSVWICLVEVNCVCLCPARKTQVALNRRQVIPADLPSNISNSASIGSTEAPSARSHVSVFSSMVNISSQLAELTCVPTSLYIAMHVWNCILMPRELQHKPSN